MGVDNPYRDWSITAGWEETATGRWEGERGGEMEGDRRRERGREGGRETGERGVVQVRKRITLCVSNHEEDF